MIQSNTDTKLAQNKNNLSYQKSSPSSLTHTTVYFQKQTKNKVTAFFFPIVIKQKLSQLKMLTLVKK